MLFTSKVTKRGQTTLPTKIREFLHAKPGDTLEYKVIEDSVVLQVKKPDINETLQKYLGAFGQATAQTTEEALKKDRTKRGWDDTDLDLFEAWAKE